EWTSRRNQVRARIAANPPAEIPAEPKAKKSESGVEEEEFSIPGEWQGGGGGLFLVPGGGRGAGGPAGPPPPLFSARRAPYPDRPMRPALVLLLLLGALPPLVTGVSGAPG